MLAAVVIPTYNEAENIRKLIPILYSEIFPKIFGWRAEVIIVDGKSTDGTGDAVDSLARSYRGLHLIREESKSGIGAAYMKGFAYSLNELSADLVIEFDADFQHPPESLIALIRKIDEGYDYVIGSRTVEGGSEPVGRNMLRTLMTEVGGLVARLVLFFPGKYFHLVTDPTSGLRATRVKNCLERLNLDPPHFYSRQFGYKLQLLYETLATGARYAEIPLKFGNREAGYSKIQAGTAWDIFMACVRTRWHGK